MKKRWAIPIVFIAILGSLVGWRLTLNRNAAVAQTQEHSSRTHTKPLVNVAVASYHDVEQTFEAVGSIDSPYTVRVAPKYAGPIDTVDVSEGQAVHAGEIVATIDPAEAQANVSQCQANVAQAEQHLAQTQLTQNANNVGIGSTIRQARAGVYSSTFAYDSAERNYINDVAAAKAAVTDAQDKLASAVAQVADMQAALTSAKASQVDAQAKDAREEALFKQGYVAAQDLDDDNAALGVANANVDVAKAQLNSAASAQESAKAELQSAQDQLQAAEATGVSGVAAARAQLDESKATLKTAVANTSQEPAYVANIDALKAALAAAQAQLHDAQTQLQYTVLRSPVDGFVVARLMDPGTQATAGQEILEIQQIKQVWVTVPVPEEQTENMHLGQAANVTLDAIPGRTFTGSISQVNASADPSSRQFSVRVTIDNPDNLIKTGMFARVDFVTSVSPHQIYVPREAVTTAADGTSTVLVVDSNGNAHERVVTVGTSDTDGFAIKSGVNIGDQVITFTAVPVKDGAAVRITGKGGHHHHKSSSYGAASS